jgi:hypothetical protein
MPSFLVVFTIKLPESPFSLYPQTPTGSLRLKQENVIIPSQSGKPTQTPTMRWVFQMLEGIDLLLILQN